jgi:glycosyltransferase involved in cell wall biosynthesis
MQQLSQASKETNPLVSVIIPCYNLAQYLGQAIESLLAQTYSNLEILVVDDGSSDQLLEVITPYLVDRRIRLLSQAKQGAATARNKGISHSRGQYLQFLDQDDWLHPEKIARQVFILKEDPTVGLVFCDYFLYFESGEYLTEMPGKVYCAEECSPFEMLWLGSSFPPHAPLVRREEVEKAGGFYPGTFCSDYDFWLRLAALDCTMHYLPEALVYYRRHSQAMTATIRQDRLKLEVARIRARVSEQFPAKVEQAEVQALRILRNTYAVRQQGLHQVKTELGAVKEELVNLNENYRQQLQSYQQHERQVSLHARELRNQFNLTEQLAKVLEAELKELNLG